MGINKRGDEFVQQIARLQTEGALTDGEVISALTGIVIDICKKHGQDPVTFMKWAITVVGAIPV